VAETSYKASPIKKIVARVLIALVPGWKDSVEEWPNKAVVIGAPHTSNWDAIFMVLIMWSKGRSFNFLVKDSVFKIPVFKYFVKWLGGIAVDRKNPAGLVQNVAEKAAKLDTLSLCITPKGTRSPRDFWKSGFYRIAMAADLPVAFGFVDSVSRRFGVGPTLQLTGDVSADMDIIRAFYAPMKGYNPEKSSVPRLRAEVDDEAHAHLMSQIARDNTVIPEEHGNPEAEA